MKIRFSKKFNNWNNKWTSAMPPIQADWTKHLRMAICPLKKTFEFMRDEQPMEPKTTQAK